MAERPRAMAQWRCLLCSTISVRGAMCACSARFLTALGPATFALGRLLQGAAQRGAQAAAGAWASMALRVSGRFAADTCSAPPPAPRFLLTIRPSVGCVWVVVFLWCRMRAFQNLSRAAVKQPANRRFMSARPNPTVNKDTRVICQVRHAALPNARHVLASLTSMLFARVSRAPRVLSTASRPLRTAPRWWEVCPPLQPGPTPHPLVVHSP